MISDLLNLLPPRTGISCFMDRTGLEAGLSLREVLSWVSSFRGRVEEDGVPFPQHPIVGLSGSYTQGTTIPAMWLIK